MSKLRLKISVSLDGFVAGPRQSVEKPTRYRRHALHEWAFALELVRTVAAPKVIHLKFVRS